MLRVLAAVIVGVALAAIATTVTTYSFVNAEPEPVSKPLHNYGSR